jgi:hypothetical protein
LRSLTSRDIAEWQAYYLVEPFGESRADLRAAITACTVANAAGGRGKGKPPFTVKDFMIDLEPPRPQSAEEMKQILKSIAGK